MGRRGNRGEKGRGLRKQEDGGENCSRSNAEGRRKRNKGMRREVEKRRQIRKEEISKRGR